MMALDAPLRLHIGGQKALPGWKILDIAPGPDVDFVGDCTDLSQFESNSLDELYLSHVLEHLGHGAPCAQTLAGFFRVLKPGGVLSVAVPDMRSLCEIFLSPHAGPGVRLGVINILFGGQKNAHDFHRNAFDEDLLRYFLQASGFTAVERVQDFGLLDDASSYEYAGRQVSLNMRARKPAGD